MARNRWLVMEPSSGGADPPFRTRLAGAGRHLPTTRLTTDELMSTTRHRTHINLERLTGIRERRVSVGDEDSYSLATAAALDCLDKAHQEASSVDAVISCSITKFRGGLTQWLEPTMSSAVAQAIGAENAMTFDLSNACAGMLSGVTVANNWIRQGTIERALVVSGEYISQLGQNAARHIRSIMSKELASLTLGDAGAALLLERAPTGSRRHHSGGFHHRRRLQQAVPRLSERRTIPAPECSPTPGEFTGRRWTTPRCCWKRCSIRPVSRYTTSTTSSRIRPRPAQSGREWHGCRPLSATRPRHDAVITVDRYGNTASTTHTVALIEELEARHIEPGETIALIALASGLEIGVVLMTLDEELVSRYGHED